MGAPLLTRRLEVHDAGPAVTLQDLGRTGYIAQGLTRGGAMDRRALHEAAALLGQPVTGALEMVGLGGAFSANEDTRIALTGAPMQAAIDGAPLVWNASHMLPAGAKLTLGGVKGGAIGYLSVGGGFATEPLMGAQSTHLAAGLGRGLRAGDALDLAPDRGGPVGRVLPGQDRLKGGEIRIVRSLQSHLFGEETLTRFGTTRFVRDARANRQGIRLNPEGEGFAAEGGLRVVSEIIAPGDIQITGDGAPYVLMCESQTTGGYPRIATVLPADLPRVAQAPLGAEVRMRYVSFAEAVAAEAEDRKAVAALAKAVESLVRDPRNMPDLLGYTLTSGAVDATGDPFEGDPR